MKKPILFIAILISVVSCTKDDALSSQLQSEQSEVTDVLTLTDKVQIQEATTFIESYVEDGVLDFPVLKTPLTDDIAAGMETRLDVFVSQFPELAQGCEDAFRRRTFRSGFVNFLSHDPSPGLQALAQTIASTYLSNAGRSCSVRIVRVIVRENADGDTLRARVVFRLIAI